MEKLTQKQFKELIKDGYIFNYGNLNKDINGYLSNASKEKIENYLNSDKVNLCYKATNIKIHSTFYTYLKDNASLVTSNFTNTNYYMFNNFIIVDFKYFRSLVVLKAVK